VAANSLSIASRLREMVSRQLRRRGLIIAMSSGIDSSVCAALAVRALGPEKVFGLIMPERDSSADSARKAEVLAKHRTGSRGDWLLSLA
jgi:NAD+ synthase